MMTGLTILLLLTALVLVMLVSVLCLEVVSSDDQTDLPSELHPLEHVKDILKDDPRDDLQNDLHESLHPYERVNDYLDLSLDNYMQDHTPSSLFLDKRAGLAFSDLLLKDRKNETLSHSRKKRATLTWPSGSRFVAEFYFTIPISAPSGVTIPFTVDVPYRFDLPNVTVADFFGIGRDNRKHHSFHDRLDVYGVVEALLDRFGMDGKSCILRAVCEKAQNHLVHTGMLGEVLTTILAASSEASSDAMYEYQLAEYYGSAYGNCRSMYPGCPVSLFKWLE